MQAVVLRYSYPTQSFAIQPLKPAIYSSQEPSTFLAKCGKISPAHNLSTSASRPEPEPDHTAPVPQSLSVNRPYSSESRAAPSLTSSRSLIPHLALPLAPPSLSPSPSTHSHRAIPPIPPTMRRSRRNSLPVNLAGGSGSPGRSASSGSDSDGTPRSVDATATNLVTVTGTAHSLDQRTTRALSHVDVRYLPSQSATCILTHSSRNLPLNHAITLAYNHSISSRCWKESRDTRSILERSLLYLTLCGYTAQGQDQGQVGEPQSTMERGLLVVRVA